MTLCTKTLGVVCSLMRTSGRAGFASVNNRGSHNDNFVVVSESPYFRSYTASKVTRAVSSAI